MRGLLIGILSFVMLLAGCSRSVDSRLVRVSQLADCNATDSALAALGNVCRDSLNEHNRYYYDLMSIKARDKAYLDITTDTTITDIIAYFERRGSENELGEAYYYGGRVSREQGDAPQALDYYQKALDVLTSPEHMYRKGKIASQMGQIFLELYMFEQAKPKFQEAIAYQTACGDSVGLMYNFIAFGENYKWLKQKDSAIYYIKESLNLAIKLNLSNIDIIECRTILIDNYLNNSELELAKAEFFKIEPYLNEDYIINSTLCTGVNMYLLKNDLDNAEKLSKRLVGSGTLYGLKFGYRALSNIAERQGNHKKAKEYNTRYKECIDSMNKDTSKKAVIHQNSFYNYSLRERENLRLKNKQLTLILVSLCSIIALLILISIVIYINKIIKRRNKALSEQNQKLQKSCDDLETKNRQLLTEQEQLNIYLTQQLNKISTLETDIKSLQENLSSRELSEKINCQILSKIKNIDTDNYILDNKILSSDVYSIFKQNSRGEKVRISEQNWIELDVLVNEVYVDFKRKLFYLNEQLGANDYQLCLLIKCKFTIKEIAELTNRGSNAVTNQRKRLYKKLFGVEGSPNDLDKYIISL